MRLIYADALMEKYHKTTVWDSWVEINNAPTVDAVPVVHGRWERKQDISTFGMLMFECSECKKLSEGGILDEPYNFCPNCGAKMDAEE